MNNMFKGEYRDELPLSYLPNILKWKTENVTNMSNMFSRCIS